MAIDWSDDIAIANLADEPALSDELSSIIERAEGAENPPHVVLDFQDVTYVNSSNIAQLLRLRKVLEGTSHALVMCGLGDEVMSVLVVSGLDKLFRMTPDMMTAIASVQIEGAQPS